MPAGANGGTGDMSAAQVAQLQAQVQQLQLEKQQLKTQQMSPGKDQPPGTPPAQSPPAGATPASPGSPPGAAAAAAAGSPAGSPTRSAGGASPKGSPEAAAEKTASPVCPPGPRSHRPPAARISETLALVVSCDAGADGRRDCGGLDCAGPAAHLGAAADPVAPPPGRRPAASSASGAAPLDGPRWRRWRPRPATSPRQPEWRWDGHGPGAPPF